MVPALGDILDGNRNGPDEQGEQCVMAQTGVLVERC